MQTSSLNSIELGNRLAEQIYRWGLDVKAFFTWSPIANASGERPWGWGKERGLRD